MNLVLEHGDMKAAVPLTERGKDNPFKSGSVGYHGAFKMGTEGAAERYQVSITAVRIGSKPTP
jgi:hypothetical protein